MSAHVIAAQAASAGGAAGSQGLWLVSRASGLILLVLFSVVMVLGVGTRTGATTRRWPRFAVAELHRSLSLFAVALLGLHVATALLDPYVSIGWIAAVLPFTSHYETLAIGAGTLAVDLGGAVLITSLLRRRLGLRTWRAVHYLAYLAWPVAFVHAIRAASYDQHLWWVALTEWGSLAAVATAVVARLVRRGSPGPDRPSPDAGRARQLEVSGHR
jgi:sulfoxide reductase heme-binding subunit YedZ